ncbi:MAG TPA: hypothetical protein VNC62_11770 [Burkholderiales bacterium]|jgi:hypothetical protein|nr:hypothetical protein [Burkholderiales bacterium]
MKEEQLREDQRREALARRDEPHSEETLPPAGQPAKVEEPARFEEPARYEEPVRAEPVKPKIDSKALLESDGLVMVETDRAKAPPAAPAAEEPQNLGRARRERAKPQAQDDELKQVETKR